LLDFNNVLLNVAIDINNEKLYFCVTMLKGSVNKKIMCVYIYKYEIQFIQIK